MDVTAMGCFSFMCKNCGKSIRSDSFTGQHCTLFLLQEGKVIEKMTGQYDSYGRVFDGAGSSVEWFIYAWNKSSATKDQPRNLDVCHFMDNGNDNDGIAAIHTRCGGDSATPTTKSEPDPEQGWERYAEPKLKHSDHVVYRENLPKHGGCNCVFCNGDYEKETKRLSGKLDEALKRLGDVSDLLENDWSQKEFKELLEKTGCRRR